MKQTIGVFFGSASVEHEVSVISAVQAMEQIDRTKYDVVAVYIAKDGVFYMGDALYDMKRYRDMPALLKQCRPVALVREGGRVYLRDAAVGLLRRGKSVAVDLAFPIVHGTNGEDGALMGLFELLRLPYIGSNVTASAAGMDKVIFKAVMEQAELPVLPCVWFYAREYWKAKEDWAAKIEQTAGFPVIVKPAGLGSSVGIKKAATRGELDEAVRTAEAFADKLLVERAVEHLREINCAVLGDFEQCEASVCEEPFMQDEILSYEDKYMRAGKGGGKGMASLARQIPAKLPENKAAEIKELACRAFAALGCSGVARIDFLLDTDQEDRVLINEINTIPGSLSFYLWEANGMSYPKLIDRLVETARRRARRREDLMLTIDTNLLSNAPSFGAKGK